MGRRTKRSLIISDLHCGHLTGLTPSDYWWGESDLPCQQKVREFQEWSWNKYMGLIEKYRPYSNMLVNGDMIDGKGAKSGGTEQLTADRDKQSDMAVACIKAARIPKIVMTYGTPYHTGMGEDFEARVARQCKAQIHSHAWIDINGVMISMKHKVGGSQLPHGKATPILREMVLNDSWCRDYPEHPLAQIFIRSHTHCCVEAPTKGSLGIVTPALQGLGSKYGARQCSGVVHWGIVVLDITPAGSWKWKVERVSLENQAPNVVKL